MLYAQVYYFHSFTQHFSTPLMSLFEVAELTRLLSYCSIFLLVHSYIQSSMCLYYKYLLYWIDCNYFCLILTLKVDISTWLFFICCYSVLLFCCWYISKHIHYYLLKKSYMLLHNLLSFLNVTTLNDCRDSRISKLVNALIKTSSTIKTNNSNSSAASKDTKKIEIH